MPEAVLRRPPDPEGTSRCLFRCEYGSDTVGVAGRWTPNEPDVLKYCSLSSSSSSGKRKFDDGCDGLNVSCDGEGDSLLDLQKPRECDCCSVTSGESVLYFSVVDGNFSIVLLLALPLLAILVFEEVLDSGRFLFLRERFIITTPSSEDDSSSFCDAQGL